MMSKEAQEYWQEHRRSAAIVLDGTIEEIKIELETGTYTKPRRKRLAELITLIDLRETYPHPRPVSSISRSEDEYRDEDHILTQEFHEQKIAEYTAKGVIHVAHSLQQFARNEELRYQESLKNRKPKPEPIPVKKQKTWFQKLFG